MLASLCKPPLPFSSVSRTLRAFTEDKESDTLSLFRSHIRMTVDDPLDPVQEVIDARVNSWLNSRTWLSVVVFPVAERRDTDDQVQSRFPVIHASIRSVHQQQRTSRVTCRTARTLLVRGCSRVSPDDLCKCPAAVLQRISNSLGRRLGAVLCICLARRRRALLSLATSLLGRRNPCFPILSQQEARPCPRRHCPNPNAAVSSWRLYQASARRRRVHVRRRLSTLGERILRLHQRPAPTRRGLRLSTSDSQLPGRLAPSCGRVFRSRRWATGQCWGES